MELQDAPAGYRWKVPPLCQAGRLPADRSQMVAVSERRDGARGEALGEGGGRCWSDKCAMASMAQAGAIVPCGFRTAVLEQVWPRLALLP